MKPFDLTRMAVSLLPACLRRPVACAILRAALGAAQRLHDELHERHDGEPWGDLHRLRHSGQTCSLESLLNDRHDPGPRRIRVGEGDDRERWHIFTANEIAAQPYILTWLDPDGGEARWLWPEADYAGRQEADFIVSAPAEARPQEANIRASVDDMKIAGVRYIIRWT